MTDSEIQALAKRCAATPTQDPKIRAWQKQPDLPFMDYTHANVLEPSANTSRRRVNYSTLFCVAMLVLLGILWLCGK